MKITSLNIDIKDISSNIEMKITSLMIIDMTSIKSNDMTLIVNSSNSPKTIYIHWSE